jgi:hypothetical protein
MSDDSPNADSPQGAVANPGRAGSVVRRRGRQRFPVLGGSNVVGVFNRAPFGGIVG